HPEYLLPLVLIAVVALFLQHGLNSLRLLLNNTFEQKVIFDLRSDLYSHIQLLPLRWFDNRATGDLMTRVLEDVTSVERVLIDGIDQGTVAVLQILIALAGMFYLSAKLTLVGLAPVPFLAGGPSWLGHVISFRERPIWAISPPFLYSPVFSTNRWANCISSTN